jgi:hypothetical protein
MILPLTKVIWNGIPIKRGDFYVKWGFDYCYFFGGCSFNLFNGNEKLGIYIYCIM